MMCVAIRDVTSSGASDDTTTSRRLAVVVSFDIDGTLERGDPPGPIPMEQIREIQSIGLIVGSASDQTKSEQIQMWAASKIEPAFIGHKHHLAEVATRFPSHRLIHIGDTDVDAHFAALAGFDFFFAKDVPSLDVILAEYVQSG
jgi:hypothetical protein